MVKIKGWKIYKKQKNSYQDWKLEKFLTGGKIFYNYKEVVAIKNKMKSMSSSFDYKVVKVINEVW